LEEEKTIEQSNITHSHGNREAETLQNKTTTTTKEEEKEKHCKEKMYGSRQ